MRRHNALEFLWTLSEFQYSEAGIPVEFHSTRNPSGICLEFLSIFTAIFYYFCSQNSYRNLSRVLLELRIPLGIRWKMWGSVKTSSMPAFRRCAWLIATWSPSPLVHCQEPVEEHHMVCGSLRLSRGLHLFRRSWRGTQHARYIYISITQTVYSVQRPSDYPDSKGSFWLGLPAMLHQSPGISVWHANKWAQDQVLAVRMKCRSYIKACTVQKQGGSMVRAWCPFRLGMVQ